MQSLPSLLLAAVSLITSPALAETTPRVVAMPLPVIAIDFWPDWGSDGSVEGHVFGANPALDGVAVYIYLETAGGWWNKPTLDDPVTPIFPDGTWITDITTGGIDEYATRVAAFVVPAHEDPPPCSPCSQLPSPSNVRAVSCRLPGSRRVHCLGYDWTVKRADQTIGKVGPGPNYFSDAEDMVWCDSEGLHLRLARQGDDWFGTEVIADASFGYGRYQVEIDGPVDSLDAQAVMGFFTWDDCAPYAKYSPDDVFREIDIEFSRWGDPGVENNAQYLLQPWGTPGHRFQFPLVLNPSRRSGHEIYWQPNTIAYQSIVPGQSWDWNYAGSDVPVPGQERLRINFWLLDGLPPLSGQPTDITIRRFQFLPDVP